jgi:multiple sugar transport system substrate-binding protein
MKNNTFQIVLTSVFVFFIILGVVVFASYKTKNSVSNSVQISVWGTVNRDTFGNFLGKLKNDKNKDIKITYTEEDISSLDKNLVEAIASGNGPDVVLLPQTLILRYLNKVYPIPFQNLPERTYLDTYIQEANLYLTKDGVIALPFYVDPLVMYWNKDNFSDAGVAVPPTKWSELPLLAGKFSKSDSNANIIKSAVSFGGYKNVDDAKGILSALMMQAGNSIVVGDGTNYKSDLDTSSSGTSSPAESALRFYADYGDPQKAVYSWNSSLPESKQFFLGGDLAMYFGYASELSDIASKNPNLNFDVAMIPQTVDAKSKSTFGNIYGFAILKNSKNIAAAFDDISYLTGNESVGVFSGMTNYIPARRDIIASGTSDPKVQVFYDSALISRGWLDPDSDKTDSIFQSMVEDITTGRTSIQDAIKKAGGQINNLL